MIKSKPTIYIRNATSDDYSFLCELEKTAFQEYLQSSMASISNSVSSHYQHVLVAYIQENDTNVLCGSAIFFIYKKTIRLYSIGVLPDHQHHGVGHALLSHVMTYAVDMNYERIRLEADAANARLLRWYTSYGFTSVESLPNYYESGYHAVRMEWINHRANPEGRMIIIADTHQKQLSRLTSLQLFSSQDYFTNKVFIHSNFYHVINLSRTYTIHSVGYYVSLLASARGHRVMPSIVTINDYTNMGVHDSLLYEIDPVFQTILDKDSRSHIQITMIFGLATEKKFNKITKQLFRLFEWPFIRIEFKKKTHWTIYKLKHISLNYVLNNYPDIFKSGLKKYIAKKRYNRIKLKNYKYDVAILVNPDDPTPPSCEVALQKFKDIGQKMGLYVEFITKRDRKRICEFDALFIRETTALNHHTYDISRQAYTEGLVVIDDPWSILMCSNKIYLHERLTNRGLSLPKSWIVSPKLYDHTTLNISTFPIVLKLPESSFSKGVYLANTSDDYYRILKDMFKKSDLVIAQEFLPTPYDWRIGIINNQPLFACKYYMASGHWQIYHWENDHASSGNWETLPIQSVPPRVIKKAVQASLAIGRGLYGIDLKEVNNDVYIIEVNDNPNIDDTVEDAVYGDRLYQTILQSLLNTIESKQNRYIA
jgi:glutathione synthase/RimK-type ligase-like ATP-grasp enzyme/ribosomal protein S18 acetylase RimI-like enzyme